MKNSDVLLDSRVVQRHIRSGKVEKSDFNNHLSSLPDLANECTEINFESLAKEKSRLVVTGEFSRSEHDDDNH